MMKLTDLKRVVGKGTKDDPARLFLTEHDGTLYATNSYWLVKAERVAPLLAHYNLPSNQPGAYNVNGSVEPRDQEPPNVGGLLKGAESWPVLERLHAHGRPVFWPCPTGGYLAAFESSPFFRKGDGSDEPTPVALNSDYLAFLTTGLADPVFRQNGPRKAVAVFDGDDFVGLVMPVRLA